MKQPVPHSTENPPSPADFRFIATNDVPANESKALLWWMTFVLFAYHYKLVVCGFFGRTLGFDCLCHTDIHGVTSNHWFEQFIYVPILWFAMYRIVQIVFGPGDHEVLGKKVRRLKAVALFFLAMYIYGIGIHFANTIEIFSREKLGIDTGPLYEQVHWVDEELSHWVQFVFYFMFFSWLIVHDRLDRDFGANLAVFTGLLHGLERAMGVIEGDSPHVAFVYSIFLLVACLLRWQRHGSDFPRVWKDFFFRHGLSFGLGMPLSLLFYQWIFGGYVQPSAMGSKGWQVVVFVAVFAGVGYCLAVLLDWFLGKKQSKPA